MFVFSNLFLSIADLLDILITLYIWVVIIRAILSWIRFDPYSPITQFLVRVTEPALSRIRRIVPIIAGLDLSPLVLILGLSIAEGFLVNTLRDLAYAIR
ncbi:MAG: YggT family protein [Calditrichaeota bacterium]|nr:MAG: YggT family protein [Calditrichota bacterium]